MPKFIYKAKSGPKDIVESAIEAADQDEAARKINQLGFFPLEIKEEKSVERNKQDSSFLFSKKIKPNHIVVFTRQLSDLLDSGLSIFQAMELVEKQTQHQYLKKIVSEVKNSIRDGDSLSVSLAKYPRVFDAFYINIVKSGELGGNLSLVLRRLADFEEKEEDLKSKIRASLAYPILIATIGALTIFILLTFVVPRLVSMFVEMSQKLPLPTLLLISLSNFFSNYWWLIFIILGWVILYFNKLKGSKEGKLNLDRLKIRLPFFGELIKKSQIAHFARTLATLLSNGVTLMQAMEAVYGILDNEVLRNDILRMLEEVNDGSSLTNAMSKSKYFPEVVVNLVAVGEQSCSQEKSLFKIAESFERQTDNMIKIITSLVEPVLILIVGLIVGFIVIAMLLPIFQMNLIIR